MVTDNQCCCTKASDHQWQHCATLQLVSEDEFMHLVLFWGRVMGGVQGGTSPHTRCLH